MKTGKMTAKEYAAYKDKLSIAETVFTEQVTLPPDEYAMVMHNFNTHMSDEDRKHAVVTKLLISTQKYL